MIKLKEENDIEVLRQVALLLDDEVKGLRKIIVRLKKQLVEAGGDPQLKLQIEELEEQLAKRNKALFGPKSEKRPSENSPKEKAEPQRGHGPRPQPELPIIAETHLLDKADESCPKCGGDLQVFEGQFEESEEIDVVERQFVIKRHRRQKYRCGCGECIETAPAPLKLRPGSRYSIDFAIGVALHKYSDHLPLERQVKIMGREGLVIDSQTLWDQINALASILTLSYNALYEYVTSKSVIGADETTWRLLTNKKSKNENKSWYVWALCADDAVYYDLADSRSAKVAAALLDGYRGAVICDDYTAYQSVAKQLPGIKLVHCWAHVRRKFVEAEDTAPECKTVIDLIGELYAVERRCPTGSSGNQLRQQLRNEESRKIVKRIQQWALAQAALPSSPLMKAIAYMGGIWKGLTAFLDDPVISLDNNATERALRGVVIGRKNHYGSKSKRGTEVAAILYSLIESAKLCGVDPHHYLRAATHAALRDQAVVLPHQLA